MSEHHIPSFSSNRRALYVTLVAIFAMISTAVGLASSTHVDAASPGYRVQLTSQTLTSPSAPNASTAATYTSVADVAEAVNPSVVTIYTFTTQTQVQQGSYQPRGRGDSQHPRGDAETPKNDEAPLAAGSGWIFSEEGYVVTNAHVVAGADDFTVRFYDGTETNARLVGADTFQDVAVLKLDLEDGQQVPGVATVGDSVSMRPGDEVIAIGSPLGEFTNSVSVGIIGGLGRSLDTGAGYRLANLIQHDAEISSGNSGGPLVNMQGQVVGMNVAKIDSNSVQGASVSGLNFAIDGNTVASIAQEIITTGKSIVYPYLGIQSQWDGVSQIVLSVEPNSPAAAAGIESGDAITAVDGTVVSQEQPLINLLFIHRPGDEIAVTVDRGGEMIDLQVTLGDRPTSLTA